MPSFRPESRGTVYVEFLLVGGIIVLVLLGIFELGRLTYTETRLRYFAESVLKAYEAHSEMHVNAWENDAAMVQYRNARDAFLAPFEAELATLADMNGFLDVQYWDSRGAGYNSFAGDTGGSVRVSKIAIIPPGFGVFVPDMPEGRRSIENPFVCSPPYSGGPG